MNVLIVGGGGREHALAWKLNQSENVKEIFCLPGNGGTSSFAVNLSLKGEDLKERILSVARNIKIDLVVVGPEKPLAEGLVDFLTAKGIAVFGPCARAAQIESSKVFAKKIMEEEGVPTARFGSFTNLEEALYYLEKTNPPYVIKADGLAQGKGVFICREKEEAREVLVSLLENHDLGNAGERVVIEEFLEGTELSFFVLTDGKNIIPFGTAHDYKAVYDGNKGPNTGGMGAFSPSPLVDSQMKERIISEIILPTLNGLKKKGIEYKGFLYAGLILTKNGPKVLEFNCRLGDPEAQVLLPRLKSDLLTIMKKTIDGNLRVNDVVFSDSVCLTVILASGGYPGKYKKGLPITFSQENPEDIKDIMYFHAGTKVKTDHQGYKLETSGGRVIAVTALGNSLEEVKEKAYSGIKYVSFPDMYYRTDIGKIFGKVD